MKTVVLVMLLFLSLPGLPVFAQEQQVTVPYTLADRDRTIRTEAKLDALEAKIDAKFNAVDSKFDSVDSKFDSVDSKLDAVNSRIDYLFWLQGVIVALIMFILGYTIWDRRTALQPALDKSIEAEAKSKNLIRILHEYSKKHPDLAEILRTHGIL